MTTPVLPADQLPLPADAYDVHVPVLPDLGDRCYCGHPVDAVCHRLPEVVPSWG